jgi:hypothetical protein
MTSVSQSVHDLATWAKAHLDELDATVTAMEGRMGSTSDEARLQAHLALLDARKWRETFRARVRDLRRTADSGAAQAKTDLDDAWNEFELAFGRWVGATGQHAEELQARTGAQANAWARLVAQYKTKLETGTKAAEAQVDAGLRTLEEAAVNQNQNLEKLQAAGAASYGAWVEALKQSRGAFEEALRATHAHFTAAK